MNVAAFWLGSLSSSAISGGDRYGLEVLRRWRERGADVHVYASRAGVSLASAFDYRLPMTSCERRESTISPHRLEYLGRLWRAALRALTAPIPDVVVAVSTYSYDVVPAAILAVRARLSRRRATFVAPVFHLIPGPTSRPGRRVVNAIAYVEQRTMIGFVAAACDVVVVDNAALYDELARRYRGLRRKLFLSGMGIAAAPAMSRSGAPRPYAIYVGRLSAAKGLADLLDCWRLLGDDFALALHLAGSHDSSLDLGDELRARGLQGRVTVYASPSDGEIRTLVADAYVAVTASREEGYGLSVLEALALGTPCVTYDLPVFREVFPFGRSVARAFGAPFLAEAVRAIARDGTARARLVADIEANYSFATWPTVADALWSRVEAAFLA